MTDLIKGSVWPWNKADLIARLLAEETDLTDCAADRIEELVKELNISRMASVVMDNTVEELESKLTKAVETLREIEVDFCQTDVALKYAIHTVLAELEGRE